MNAETEIIAGTCPFCGETIIGDLEQHQYHGDDSTNCPKCGSWINVHLIAQFVVTVNKGMQEFADAKKETG